MYHLFCKKLPNGAFVFLKSSSIEVFAIWKKYTEPKQALKD